MKMLETDKNLGLYFWKITGGKGGWARSTRPYISVK